MAERKNSEKRIATNNRWTNAHYDRINIAVPKGRKDEIKVLADTQGQSVNAYIISAIDEKMERDSADGPQEVTETAQRVGGIPPRHAGGGTEGRRAHRGSCPGLCSTSGRHAGAAGQILFAYGSKSGHRGKAEKGGMI